MSRSGAKRLRLSPTQLRAALLAAISIAAFSACGGSNADGTGRNASTQIATGTSSPPPQAVATIGPTATSTLRDLSYRVQGGDTLGSIGERFGVTVDAIIAENELSVDADIAVGQILVIKGVDPALAGAEPPAGAAAESPIGFYLAMPIEGACLTTDDSQMPNAPREYRYGTHEGVDFFTGFACVDVPIGQPVLAAYEGTVIRADEDYRELTIVDLNELYDRTAAQGYTDPGSLDKFRGRQVWIDHGNGIVTRYCHLSGVADDVHVGTKVSQGQVIGFVGDSGSVEAVSDPGYNKHLHFEVRVGKSFLGAGLSPDEVRALYEAVFHLR